MSTWLVLLILSRIWWARLYGFIKSNNLLNFMISAMVSVIENVLLIVDMRFIFITEFAVGGGRSYLYLSTFLEKKKF